MSNFIVEIKKGQRGGNRGLPLGPGLDAITKAINGVQKAMMIGVAAAPKVGKSTFTDYAFVIQPYLYSLKVKSAVKWTYFSFEMDRVTKEIDFASFFLFHDFGHNLIKLPEGILVKGQPFVHLSSSYLRGRMQDDNGEIVKMDPKVEEDLKEVYTKRIVPLFGEYSEKGVKLSDGLIDFIEQKDNPTGLRNHLLATAERDGELLYENFTNKEGYSGKKLVGYVPNDPDLLHVIVTDTIRKLKKERGFNMKETIDKYLEYSTELRNMCQYTFIHIVHLNRNMSDVHRMKMLGDMLYPTPEDIKDTGNLSEECDHLFTLFNPNDERYNLSVHFGLTIKDSFKNEIYPNMRTVHLVESRHVSFPQHFKVEMEGNIKNFNQLKI